MSNPLRSRLALVLAVLMSCLCPVVVHAQSSGGDLEQWLTPEQMHETGLDTLTPAQLGRLNELLRARNSTPIARVDDNTPAGVAVPPVGAGNDPTRAIGLVDGPIRTRVKGEVAGWAPGTVFEFENGQQWKVLKGSVTLRRPLASPEVQLVPGVAGRWFLQIDEDTPRPRIYRID